MSTPNIKTYEVYKGNQSSTTFAINFPYKDKSEVVVYIRREKDLFETKLETFRYEWLDDNTITFPVLEDDAILDYKDLLLVRRETPLGSPYEFENQRRLFPSETMEADDLSFRQIQELAQRVDRALVVPFTEDKTPNDMWTEFKEGVKSATESALQSKESASKSEAFANIAIQQAELATQAANDPNVIAVGEDIRGANTIGTVASDIESVKAIAENIDNIKTSIGLKDSLQKVIDNEININTVATNIDDVAMVSAVITDVKEVSKISSEVMDVAANEVNITTVATNIDNIINAVDAKEVSEENVEEARKWAIGTIEERVEGSSKYWANKAYENNYKVIIRYWE